jgi:hypothetical protein
MTIADLKRDASSRPQDREPTIGLVKRACYVAPIAVAQVGIYWLLNHYPPFAPRELPLTWIDRALPFSPWTIWGYFALIAMAVLLPLGVDSRKTFRRLLLAYGLAMGTAWLFFIFFPTRYIRPPLPDDDSWPSMAYRNLLTFDSPLCCFPSSHVIVPLIACAALRNSRYLGAFWYPLAALVLICSFSILTMKQHYLWDLLGGASAAALGWFVSGWGTEAQR